MMPVLSAAWGLAVAVGCTTGTDDNGGSGGTNGIGGTNPPAALGGYVAPGSVLILNQGAPRVENGSVTWISSDGAVEQDIYRTVNGSDFGNTAQDLCLCDGKIYLMSNNSEVPDLGSGVGG